MTGTALAIAVVVASVAGHLLAEATGRRRLRAALKLTASAGFLAVGVLARSAGRWSDLVLAGLALSAAGDLFLLARAKRWFLAGIGSFLLAHVAYAAAFAPHAAISPALSAVVAAVAAVFVRWLWPHLGSFRGPVVVYAVVISAMLVLALGVAHPLVPLGAALFYVSDLTVARDRFVRPGLGNRIVGLPLYYAGQVLLALSAARPPG